MNIHEVAKIASGLAMIRVENEKFIADLGDVIKMTLKNATPTDLILLVKGGYYMRKFKHTADIYAMVHASCMSKHNLREFSEAEEAILCKLYSSHGIMHDSPFVSSSRR
jgi:hypothetical protein